jgi:hypothetical protein
MNSKDLLDEAARHASYWEGEGVGALIDRDIEAGDYKSLRAHLKESAAQIFQLEYNPDGVTAGDTSYLEYYDEVA